MTQKPLHINIDSLSAGEEIDSLVALYVMLWNESNLKGVWRDGKGSCFVTGQTIPRTPHELFRPSADMGAAWKVVEHLAEGGVYTTIYTSRSGYQVIIAKPTRVSFVAIPTVPSAPLAICQFALKAVLEL